MALISLSAAAIPSLTILNAPTLHPKSSSSTLKFSQFHHSTLRPFSNLTLSKGRVFASPETLNAKEIEDPSSDTSNEERYEVEGSEVPTSSLIAGTDVDKMAPKQKIRIKLRSYWVPLIEDSCKQIMDAARTTNAKTMGPVPLPTKKRVYCVLKSPHVDKDARDHFEIRTHQRLIDILYPTAQTIDSLMQLDLPAGVDVEVKL